MKKSLIVTALAASLMLAALSPAFGDETRTKKRQRRVERTEEAAYTAPAPAVHGPGGSFFAGACHHEERVGCVAFPIESNRDRFVSIEVVDQSGLPVHAVVLHPETRETVAEFCGKTAKPIFLPAISEVDVWLLAGACPAAAPSVVTAGRVTATFSNLP